jgi:transposase
MSCLPPLGNVILEDEGSSGGTAMCQDCGVGPLVATTLAATVPDPTVFRSGRDLSAWIGLVPKQNSSSGKEKLGGISKASEAIKSTRHPWLNLLERLSSRVVAVALANKVARVQRT